MSFSVRKLLPEPWRPLLAQELEKPYLRELETFLDEEAKQHHVLPPPERVFTALAHTPPGKVKVVLLGQDPYPTLGNANGLCFSVERGQKIPGSLRNIFKNLNADLGLPIPKHGNLMPWADQGVLLLNTVLTVREGDPLSHRNKGWETFTRAILEKVAARSEPCVFLLLGKAAQEFAKGVDGGRHRIITAPHPSPASPGNPFGKTRPFSAVNAALEELRLGKIDWALPDC